MDEKRISELVQARQEKFIEDRTVTETEVNKFLKSIESFDEDIRTQCGWVAGITAKDLFSSLWETPFDMDKYKKQLAAFKAYEQKVAAVCDRINAEALECLKA